MERNHKSKDVLPLPPRPSCIGREPMVEHLVGKLLAREPRPVTVLGPPGVGKSTLTLAALHHPFVLQKYGRNRYFIRLDGARTAATLNSEIAQQLGLSTGLDLPIRLELLFCGEPALLVLDNAETPWEGDPRNTEALLSQLADVPGLMLLLSVRGAVQPSIARAGKPILVPPLDLEAARELFHGIAHNIDPNHPRLHELLDRQEGLALAIELLAHAAQGSDLEWTYTQWKAMHSRLLDRGDRTDRTRRMATSLELSLQSRRMTDAARRLLSVLSRLPAGVAQDDLPFLLPDDLTAPAVLSKAGLAFFDDSKRLRVLAPIREYMKDEHPALPEDWARACAFYSKLAREQGPLVGKPNGALARERLSAEVPNLEVVLLDGLTGAEPLEAISTVLSMNNFMRFSGYGSLAPLEQALERARRLGNPEMVAQCTYTLGEILLRRSEHKRASELFHQALPLFERLEDLHGQARCIQSMGSVALDHLELERARNCFERALPLRERMKDHRGSGNCQHGLGKVALAGGRPDEARLHFRSALRLFEEAGDALGRAYCLRSLGELDGNITYLSTARNLFEETGDFRGQGHSLRGLAEIARRNGQWETASSLYEEAKELLKQVGSIRGVANCMRGIGLLMRARGDLEGARLAFEQALHGYQQVEDHDHITECHQQLSNLGSSPTST